MKDDCSDSGFTLIEMLVATVVLGLIIGPMTAAIILGFKTEGVAAERLTTSQGRFLLNVYLPRDAMEAFRAYGSSPAVPFASTCAGQNAPPSVGQNPPATTFASASPSVPLVLTWTAQTATTDPQGHVTLTSTSYEVDYVLATEPGHPDGMSSQVTGDWLWRFVFTTSTPYFPGKPSNSTCTTLSKGTLITRDVDPSAGAIGTVTNSGSGLLQSVSLKYTDSAGNSYIASGGARA